MRLLLILALLSASACKPLLMLPGGALEGTPSAPPSDWSALHQVKTVQLETRLDDPYSVNIWVISEGEHLYVHAGANRATWVENMLADPNVRLLVEGRLYSLVATRVSAQAEFDRFSELYEIKYDRRPRNEDVAEAYLFRLRAADG